MKKIKLGIFFGGVAPEHEVSIITAVQLMKKVDLKKYELIPIYIDKKGNWWTGEKLLDTHFYKKQDLQEPKGLEAYNSEISNLRSTLDVAILCFHGEYGEGGNIQGLLEVADIPYQGPGVLGSSACMDKIMTRQILESEDISQPRYIWFTKKEWEKEKKQVLQKIEKLAYPLFVKPSRSGSTIGVVRVNEKKELESAIKDALQYDTRIIVDQGIVDCIEVNISVLGTPDNCQTSTSEQPLAQDELLSFADKYERGGGKKSGMASANRRIPAPISSSLQEKLQQVSKRIFTMFDLSGVVRIDFFADPSTEEYYVIEVNTIPGSMSFYLWEASNIRYSELIDRLVEIAQEQHEVKKGLTTTFASNILRKN